MCLLLSNRFKRQTENVFYKYLDISRSIKSPSLYLPLSEGFANFILIIFSVYQEYVLSYYVWR